MQHFGLRYVTRCITWDFALWLNETLDKSESINETMTRCITWVSTLLIPEEPQVTLLISTCPVPTAQRRITSEKRTGMTRWITWVSTFLTWTGKTQLQWASRYFNEHQCSGGDDSNYTWCREKLGRSPVRVRTSDTRAQWRCGSNHILLKSHTTDEHILRPRQRFAQTFPCCQTVSYENLSQQQAPAETLLLGVGAALLSSADNSWFLKFKNYVLLLSSIQRTDIWDHRTRSMPCWQMLSTKESKTT